jgi:hypothetical protein
MIVIRNSYSGLRLASTAWHGSPSKPEVIRQQYLSDPCGVARTNPRSFATYGTLPTRSSWPENPARSPSVYDLLAARGVDTSASARHRLRSLGLQP